MYERAAAHQHTRAPHSATHKHTHTRKSNMQTPIFQLAVTIMIYDQASACQALSLTRRVDCCCVEALPSQLARARSARTANLRCTVARHARNHVHIENTEKDISEII